MKTLIGFLACAVSLGIESVAVAEQTAFYYLATEYDDAVRGFDQIAGKTRGIDRSDRRLIGKFAKEVRKLRTAARNPRHRNRMLNQWREVQRFQTQVQSRIFDRYTPKRDLDLSWNEVLIWYRLIDDEFFYYIENPRNASSVRRIPRSNTLRDRYYGSETQSPPPSQ